MSERPRFGHDCVDCIFVGRFSVTPPLLLAGDYDGYWCPRSGSVIARYGDDGPEYTSCQGARTGYRGVFALDPRLAEVRRLAREQELIPIVE